MTKILKIIQFGTEVVILILSGIELTEAIKRLRNEKQQTNN